MARARISTTVDEARLTEARRITGASTDAALFDAALEALLADHRAGEIDRAYAAYDEHAIDEPDAWGELAAFRSAAGSS